MAVDFLDEIYKEANLIFELKKIMRYAYSGQVRLLTNAWKERTEDMVSFSQRTLEWDEVLGGKVWNEIGVIREHIIKDEFASAADAIEGIIPLMYDAMALRGAIDVSEGEDRLFSSKSGFLCIQNLQTGKKRISEIDPAFEAYSKAQILYDYGKTAFCTLGCELGYLAWQMYEASDESIDIYIYETDEKKIEYAKAYGVLDWISEDKLHVVVKKNPKELMDEVLQKHLNQGDEAECVLYVEDEFCSTLDGQSKEMAGIMLQKIQTHLNFIDFVERNFFCNYRAGNRLITELDVSSFAKDWIVVGGGPSVNYNIDYLKEMSGKKVIIAATTILKRLIDEGIRPDFIAAIDMQKRTFKHLESFEDLDIPLIMTDCANWKFAKLYKGEKYLIPTGGLLFSSVVYEAKGLEPWTARGTVTAMAIEVAVRSGAKTVELVGLDFAYPDNASHADGVMDKSDISNRATEKVPAVCGGMVSTSAALKSYLSEVEYIISGNSNVRFVNLSKYGALIHGCK